ncbi:NAD(P)-dependent oxidoreductase [Symbiobacterium thermophilum]|uniref:Phosphoglycerate dehydrogenase, C-terminal domain n=1 Tax=Symbiobacterium thermophilum (strain DSM 24528 / JCM 14929 / IAM 14863 / T) TaxID=292459 RepID=Q67M77_SYMTH|nr:NAD(P)-dependent oxidoreductase [Symbiobacterium thermophilum]BAD41216.1 phosphoglycerate dehydrogenase, C-terminal domain [Symbiobacterium thermophilum IAM 14863]
MLGLVGIGRIGTQVARKAQAAFDMQVIGYDPYVAPEAAQAHGIRMVADLAELFRTADVVSIHAPLTPETRGLVTRELIGMMKPTAFLVNFARGEIVDEGALVEALREERIAGAALDVFEREPVDPENPLLQLDNVLLSPHSAAQTRECVIRMSVTTAQGVIDALTGRRPRYIVNPEVLLRSGRAGEGEMGG